MAAWTDLQSKELHPKYRQTTAHTTHFVHTRMYAVAYGDPGGLTPNRGAAVTLRDVSSTGVAQPRVMSWKWVKNPERAEQVLQIAFYEVRAYADSSGNLPEIGGSRARVTADAATRLIVSTDGTTGVPARGDYYPGDSGELGRRALDPTDDTTTFPGLHLHIVTYRGFLVY